MPTIRKLAPEEVQALQTKGLGTRKLIEAQYDAILGDYAVGEYGEAVLDEDEKRLTVRNRLRAAATRRDLGLEFRRTSGDLIRFRVVEHSNGNGHAVAEPPAVISSEPPAKNKGGHPKAAEKGPVERLEEIAGKLQDAATGALENIGLRKPGRPAKKA